MFEESLLSATSPGVDPVTGLPVAWHPGWGEWVPVQPCDLVDPELDAMLDRLAAEYAVPAAGVLLVDVDEVPAGPELAVPLARLDLGAASAADLVETAAGLGRLEAWAAARKAAVLDELASRAEMRPDVSGYRSANPVANTAMTIAGRCHQTARQAENQVGHSQQLVEDFPDTHTLLASGLIDLRRARVITDELGGQDDDVRARVEAAALPVAPGLDSVALRKLIRRLLHELAPVEQAERHETARDGRYVAITPASDGMAHVEARLAAVDATALNTALNAAAADAKRADAAAGAPARTRDQRRADALADLAWDALTAHTDNAAHATVAHDACTHDERTAHDDRTATGATAAAGADADRARAAGRTSGDPPADAADAAYAVDRTLAVHADHDSPGGRTSDAPPADAAYGADRTLAVHADRDPGTADTGHAADPTLHADRGSPAARPPGEPPPDTDAADAADAGHRAGTAGTGTAAPDTGRDGAGRPAGTRPRRPVSVHVTIPFTTLAGLSDEPGELDGYGPIPAHVARALATEGVWTWLRTDPGTGRLLELGRTRYRPTKALAEFIVARDKTCRAPGCHRPARGADLDHIIPFHQGGTTSPGNLHALCETHHLLKHRGHWRVERQPDGTTTWTSPTGHHYRRGPERPMR